MDHIYRRSRDAVVFIETSVVREGRSPFGPEPKGGTATGSGFVYDDRGHVVTNAHVIENARDVAIEAGQSRLIDAAVHELRQLHR